MESLRNWQYAAVFLLTATFTLGLTPLALRVALRRGVLDQPNDIKAQTSPVPYLGGTAIVVAFAVVVMVAAVLKQPEDGLVELAVILGVGVALSVVGLVDDLVGLGPWIRLALEAAAGVAVAVSGEEAQLFGNDAVNIVVTVLWVVAVTNALNLLDNMDGLSAGVAAIAALFFFVIAAVNGQFLVATLAVALAGCAVGFLPLNVHPARIYMGDAGSLFLGFMLAVLGIKLRFDAPRQVTLFVPVLVLGVPLFDTILVTVNRLLHKRSPISGGRDHTSHRMVLVGVPVPATVTLIYLGAATLGWLALIMSRLDRGTALLLMSWILVVTVCLAVILSRVPVYATSKRRLLMLQEVARHEPEPPRPHEDDAATG